MCLSPHVEFKAPLDEVAAILPQENIAPLAEEIFSPVEAGLNEHYPGGVFQARVDLEQWFIHHPGRKEKEP